MKTLYKNFILLDGTKDMVPQNGKFLLVENGAIVNVLDQEVPSDEIVDLNGKYIIPGLINLHIHLPGSGNLKNNANSKKLVKLILSNPLIKKIGLLLCKKNAKDQLLSGTTTVRCVGGVGHLDSEIRNAINRNKIIGPRMLVSDYAIAPENGHMVGTVSFVEKSKEDIKKYIDDLYEHKVNLIKIMITGGVLDGKEIGKCGLLKMNPEDVKYACDLAHEKSLKVAAHVEGEEGMMAAIDGGVDTIEHGASVSDEYLEKFKARNGAITLTLSPAVDRNYPENISEEQKIVVENTKIILHGMIDNAKKCLEKGINLGLGTDTGCPGVRHYDSYKEMLFFIKYFGVTSKFALYSMTLNNAKIAGIDKDTGSIEKGKSADFIVLDSDPLIDLNVLSKPYMVVFKGKRFENPKIRKNKKIEIFTSTKDIKSC